MRKYFFLVFLLIFACSQNGGQEVKYSVKTGYVSIGDVKLYYEEKGEGEPVVMIHGGFIDSRMWDGQFDVLAEEYRAVRYDARGHGRSGGKDSVFADIEDLHLILQELNIEKAVLMGLSMGGQISTDFTLEYPDKVKALVLAGPGMSGYPFESPEVGEYIRDLRSAFAEDNFESVIECFARAWTDGPQRQPEDVNPDVRTKILDMLSGSQKRWEISHLSRPIEPPAMDRLSEIKIPVLVIAGSIDMPDILDIVNIIENSIPGARKVLIQDAAHMVNMEKPEEFNRLVLEFLKNLEK